MIRVAINGFGRIGRNTLKAGWTNKNIDFVAVNDLTDTKTLAHLLTHDSVYGKWNEQVSFDRDNIIIGRKKVKVYAEKDPLKLPWKKYKIDVVLECTGFFTTEDTAKQHITAGAKRVIISAPADGGYVPTHVFGVNHDDYKAKDLVINNASCTTNCVAPVVRVIHSSFHILKAMMTTVHAYTATQKLVDTSDKDLRRARAAGINIVPTSTGAAKATTLVIPGLKGLFDGIAMRVPVPVGSISDFTFLVKKKTTVEAVNNALLKASQLARYKGVLEVSSIPLVSTDIIHNPCASIVDPDFTRVIDGDFVKVVSWYDNEWGYSNQLVKMAVHVGKTIK